MKMNLLDILAYALVVVGGINWGLIGFFDYNLVAKIFGSDATITKVIYDAVGIAALYMLYTFVKVNRVERAQH